MQTGGYSKISIKAGVPQVPSFLQGFNRRWFAGHCEAIYLCYNTKGAAEALEDAISNYGHQVKIKGGGHCYENFVFNNDTKAIIDVGPMNDAGFDTERGFYLGAGGTNWSAFKTLFRDFGKVLPAGSCYSVGLGGHICGGGYGLLSRLNGLTVDWLTGVEVVVKPYADQAAFPIYVSVDDEDERRDLYWASCGGGGGNFGVITKYFFKTLPTVPYSALLTTLAFDWQHVDVDRLQALLNWYADFSANTNWHQFGLFKLQHASNKEFHLVIQTAITDELNKKAAHALVNRQLRELSDICPHRLPSTPVMGHGNTLIHPASSQTIEYTYYEVAQTLNGSGANQRGKYKSAYMRKAFPAEQVQAIYNSLHQIPKGLESADMQQSLLQVDSYGGRINTKGTRETAIAQRSSIMKLQYQTYWATEANDQAHLDWIRNFYTNIYAANGGTPNPKSDPTNNVDGCYFNYCDSDLNELVGKEGALRLYFQENLDRLVATKQQWDPNNYFNSAQSIPTTLS